MTIQSDLCVSPRLGHATGKARATPGQWAIAAALSALIFAGCSDFLAGAKLTSSELKTELKAGCADTAKLNPFIQDADCACAADKVAATYPDGLKYESVSDLASMASGTHKVSKQFQSALSACVDARKADGKKGAKEKS